MFIKGNVCGLLSDLMEEAGANPLNLTTLYKLSHRQGLNGRRVELG